MAKAQNISTTYLIIGILLLVIVVLSIAFIIFYFIKYQKKRRQQKQEKDIYNQNTLKSMSASKKKEKNDAKKGCKTGATAMPTKGGTKVSPVPSGMATHGVVVPMTLDSILTLKPPKKEKQQIMQTGIQPNDEKPKNNNEVNGFESKYM